MLSEWWYYTGHLSSPAGERFGFEFVVFQSVRGAHPIGRLAHFAVTDPGAARFAYDARSAIAARLPPMLDLDVQGWTLSGGAGEDRFSAQMEDYGLDLQLQSFKPAALHHGN